MTESAWDYPRPPRVEPSSRRVQVLFADRVIADTTSSLRVLETSHPPVFYVPRSGIDQSVIVAETGTTYCEFKGVASYWSVRVDDRVSRNAAWEYKTPTAGYEALIDHLAFYPGRVDRCLVDGEEVRSQEGDFYGGWITSEISGPFKGAIGTQDW